jgi:hypothetical protein
MFFENLSGRKAPAKFYFKDDDLQTWSQEAVLPLFQKKKWCQVGEYIINWRKTNPSQSLRTFFWPEAMHLLVLPRRFCAHTYYGVNGHGDINVGGDSAATVQYWSFYW